ncbi:MAG: hypothetical protein H6711_19675 [Myxococcales bacterium]|nr:hypothetical protein [Myxococcales bacterium]
MPERRPRALLALAPVLALALAPSPADAAPRGGELRTTALPEESAVVLALLADIAEGRGASPVAKQAAARLGGDARARALASELVATYNNLTPNARAALFPRIKDAGDITRAGSRYAKIGQQAPLKVLPGPIKIGPEVLPPEFPYSWTVKNTLLSYAGVRVNKVADKDGSDELVVYSSFVTTATTYGEVTYPNLARATFPGAGVLSGLGLGAVSTAGAGPAVDVPYANHPGFLIVSAVLEDDGGDAAVDVERLDLLLEAAMILAPTFPGEELHRLESALQYSIALMRIGDPKRWGPTSVLVRRMEWPEYVSLYGTPPKKSYGIGHKLKFDHAIDGGAYTVFYDLPTYLPPRNEVVVALKKVEALGPVKDLEDDGLADLGARVTIRGVGSRRAFTPNQNSVSALWSLSRAVLVGGPVEITVEVFEEDPSPYNGLMGPYPNVEMTCDVNPVVTVDATCGWGNTCKSPVTALRLFYDPASGKISGDLSGSKGQDLTATGDPGDRQARVTLSITHK